ncbi:MAG: hypothetical protein DRH17_14220 [Deltaproteobacteria bacterium]|nr:MAG: hypothetical protein DRH17_14220 [Deltaproteobacteria bacterium]
MSAKPVYADENVRKRIVRELKRMGVEVKWVIELGLRSISNSELLSLVARENAVLLTHDSDFTRVAIPESASVIYIHPLNSDEKIVELLPKLLEMTRSCRLIAVLADGSIECFAPRER